MSKHLENWLALGQKLNSPTDLTARRLDMLAQLLNQRERLDWSLDALRVAIDNMKEPATIRRVTDSLDHQVTAIRALVEEYLREDV